MRRMDDAAIPQPTGIQKPSFGTRRVRHLLSRLVLKPVASPSMDLNASPGPDADRPDLLPPGMAQRREA